MKKIRDLLVRAGVSHDHAFNSLADDELPVAIETIVATFVELDEGVKSPDATWWRDYYETTGEPMSRTDEGWMPAADAAEDHIEVFETVNVP